MNPVTTANMKRTHIFHIADIHIHAHNYAHIAYAWKKFIAAILAWPDYKTTAILAIAGDIFDHKMWLQAADITLFNSMMSDLEQHEIRTIMMPGNHDYNINQGAKQDNDGSADKILALVKTANYKFITHCSLSQVVVIDNIAFFIHSPIDLGTPRPGDEHKDFKKVAMVHEPLTNSHTGSGITFQSQRFSASNFAPIFDLTLLGDIHLPQKLAQNVAYAGSFVQKNRGEGLEHGYMLWDVEKNNGIFIEIPQLSLHIKVNAAGDAEPVLPMGTNEMPIVARTVQLHYTRCTDEWVRKYSNVLQETYKKPIDGAYNKDKLGVTEIKSVAPAPTVGELDAIILSKLTTDTSILPQQRDRVIAIHRSMFEARTTRDAPPSDWRIRHLSWSNLYCYGEDNWLDFDALENMNSILGPNKTGKSSIIDILILVLFNETVRGIKKFALNTSARHGHIKCIISVGADFYSIERAWIDTNSVVVRIYRNGVNISGTDMPGTYQIIENIIGSKRIFINTAIALQQRQFLVDLSSKERYELVCRMIDLDRLRSIEDDTRVNIRVEKKVRQALGDPIDIASLIVRKFDLETNIGVLNTSITTCLSRMETIRSRIQLIMPDSLITVPLSCSEISKRVEIIEMLGDFRDQALLTSSLVDKDRLMAEYAKLMKEIEFITEKITQMRASFQPEPKDITFEICNMRISAMSTLNISATMSDFTKHSAEKIELERTITAMQNELKICNATIIVAARPETHRPSAEIDAEITILVQQEFAVDRTILDEIPRLKAIIDANTSVLLTQQAKLATFTKDTRTNAAYAASEQKELNIIDIEAEIKSSERLSSGFAYSLESIGNLGKLMSIGACDAAPVFQWNLSCCQCDQNREILGNSDIAANAIKTETTRLESQINVVNSRIGVLLAAAREHYSKETKQLALTIKSDYNQLMSICKRRDAADNANKLHAQLASQLIQAREYESRQEDAKQKCERIKILQSEINKITDAIRHLESAIALSQEQIAMYQSLESLRAAHTIFVSNRAIQAEIVKKEVELRIVTASKQTTAKEIERLKLIIDRAECHKAKIVEMNELTSMFETARVAEDAQDEIETLNVELNQRTGEHKSLLGELAQETHSLGMLVANIKTSEISAANILASDTKLADLELYDRIINHKSGIPVEMMRLVCLRIQNKCNEVFEQIADFRIGVIFDDEVHLNVITGTSIVSAEQSSGYQKFIIDIIMRQVLCSLTATGCPRILFVDEGFGSADESNFGVICRSVLPLLARSFEKVVVVSHIAGIHEYTTGNCVIKLIGDKSKLEFGPRDAEKMKLRVLDDHAESQKATHEEKEARKIVDKAKRAADREQKKQEDKKAIGDRVDSIGETIFTRVDPKTVKCEACDKVYKETLNFTAKHITSAIHLKNLAVWLKTAD